MLPWNHQSLKFMRTSGSTALYAQGVPASKLSCQLGDGGEGEWHVPVHGWVPDGKVRCGGEREREGSESLDEHHGWSYGCKGE